MGVTKKQRKGGTKEGNKLLETFERSYNGLVSKKETQTKMGGKKRNRTGGWGKE